jgi:hypothetical protein
MEMERKGLVVVTYVDHVIFSRSSPLACQPQVRTAVGWLSYECSWYLTITWDYDVSPPTIKGGDPKASGLVLLKSDILELSKLQTKAMPLQESSEWQLNSPQPTVRDEFALKPNERKTHGAKDSTRADQA